jgi:hypothetical protein
MKHPLSWWVYWGFTYISPVYCDKLRIGGNNG